MSNFLAVATVTAAITHLLEGVRSEVQGTKITTRPPDIANSEVPPTNKLNLSLVQVLPNPAFRNQDLPTRDSSGERQVKRPRLALDLSYLLTAYASDNDDLTAQQILASAMMILDENPVISKEVLRDAISSRQNLKMSDLVDQIESIRLTLQPMNLEELSKLWSTFFQTTYRISVAYRVSVVILESKLQPKPSLPVRERIIYALPFRQPVIEGIEPQVLEAKTGARITITGKNLKSEEVRVHIDDIVLTPKRDDVSDAKISVEVPITSLGAGIRRVHVSHLMMLGSPAKEHSGSGSNSAAFVLSPRIKSAKPAKVKPGGDLTIDFEPAATPGQKVVVLLGDAATIPMPKPDGNDPFSSLTVEVPEDLPNGKFLVRLRIDGAESFLETDDDDPKSSTYQKFVGPAVEVKKS
jgi:hypothetical protein